MHAARHIELQYALLDTQVYQIGGDVAVGLQAQLDAELQAGLAHAGAHPLHHLAPRSRWAGLWMQCGRSAPLVSAAMYSQYLTPKRRVFFRSLVVSRIAPERARLYL